jgi:hypothetical protein
MIVEELFTWEIEPHLVRDPGNITYLSRNGEN